MNRVVWQVVPRGYGTVQSGSWHQGVIEPCSLVGSTKRLMNRVVWQVVPRGYGTVQSGRCYQVWGEHDDRDSSVGKVTRLWQEHRGILVRFPAQIYVYSTASKRSSGADQITYSMNTVGAVLKGSRSGMGSSIQCHHYPAPSRCAKKPSLTFYAESGDNMCIKDMTISIFRTTPRRCRQNFPPKWRHPQLSQKFTFYR